jgi:hypothetical protein
MSQARSAASRAARRKNRLASVVAVSTRHPGTAPRTPAGWFTEMPRVARSPAGLSFSRMVPGGGSDSFGLPRQFGRRFPAAAVAGVWLYHGLWCKLLGGCPEQALVVGEVPGLGGRRAKGVLLGLGLVETALAGWVISGVRPRLAAATGTLLVVGMNAGGLIFGRRHIAAPKALVLENLGFVALAWLAAESDRVAVRT